MSVIAGRYSAWRTVRVSRWLRATSAGSSLLKQNLLPACVRRVRLVLGDVEAELREHGSHVVVADLRSFRIPSRSHRPHSRFFR